MAFCFRIVYAVLMVSVLVQVGGAVPSQQAWDDYCENTARITGSKCNFTVGLCEGSSVPCGGADVPPSSAAVVGPTPLSSTTGTTSSTSSGTTTALPYTGPSSTA
ncbi:hypothetical protein FOZ63_014532, partial [Perkinsus olseni]